VGDDVLVGVALGGLVLATPRLEDALPPLRDAEAHLRSGGAIERLAGLLSGTGFYALGQDAYRTPIGSSRMRWRQWPA
jgi:hypothetical protein